MGAELLNPRFQALKGHRGKILKRPKEQLAIVSVEERHAFSCKAEAFVQSGPAAQAGGAAALVQSQVQEERRFLPLPETSEGGPGEK